jgi:hypothetical protein
MKASHLKIASVVSALIVFFPTRSKILIPFGFILSGYENYSEWQGFVITTIVLISLIYLIYSAIKGFQSKTDCIISLVPLLAFLLFFATFTLDFIYYPNWLSLVTGILSVIIISTTVLKLIKQLRISDNKSRS